MWKVLFLTLLVVAVSSAGQFPLKSRARQRLRMSLEEECKKYDQESKVDKAYDAVMTGVACLYNDTDICDALNKYSRIYSKDTLINAGRAACKIRHKILPCYHVLLQAFAPCAPPSVQQQIETLQSSFEELAEYVCADDCKTLRQVAEDGAFECFDEKTAMLNRCTANMTDLATELPEDTTTFAAIDTCYRFDSMVSCVTEALKSCPNESIMNYMNSIFSLLRKGTYCHITLPLEKDEDQSKETTEKTDNNKL